MGVKLIGVRKDAQGNISEFLTDDEQVVSFAQAKEFAQNGQLDSLTDIETDGTWRIDTFSQHLEGSNLADLPEF